MIKNQSVRMGPNQESNVELNLSGLKGKHVVFINGTFFNRSSLGSDDRDIYRPVYFKFISLGISLAKRPYIIDLVLFTCIL